MNGFVPGRLFSSDNLVSGIPYSDLLELYDVKQWIIDERGNPGLPDRFFELHKRIMLKCWEYEQQVRDLLDFNPIYSN